MLRRSLALLALCTAVATTAHAQRTAGLGLAVNVVPELRVLTYGSLDFGTVGGSSSDQTLTLQPDIQRTAFQIVGEPNRVVAVNCPASVTLVDPAQGGTGPVFTPKFALFTPTNQQSAYVRGAGGCPSVTLQKVVTEGQIFIALGGDLLIPGNFSGKFVGTYTISVAYP